MVSDDHTQAVETVCPRCGHRVRMGGKSARQWFTVFFLPIFPISGRRQFSQCPNCGAQFAVGAAELAARVNAVEAEQNQRAIALYNSLRNSPANSVTLNDLMQMYAGMNEYDQAASAAAQFPEALNASEQCMATLGRVYLAQDRHAEAIQWFDAALARNPQLGEASYYKAVALMTAPSADPEAAVAAARQARNAGYPRADELLREAEKRRGQAG
jgi:tetratricopeptide (TPR) repeat protein